MDRAKVTVVVYDLSRGVVKVLSKRFMDAEMTGIWHTGVVVFGTEYFVAGGIRCLPSGSFSVMQNIKIHREIDMGETKVDEQTLREFIQSLHSKYDKNKYDMFTNNCNHFSNEVLSFLKVSTLPSDISNQIELLSKSTIGNLIVTLMSGLCNDPLE